MDNSIYIALSRQLGQFDAMAVAANNIANINTPGFQSQKMTFSQYLVDGGDVGTKEAYVNAPVAYRDLANGTPQMTGNPLDLAIAGQGYFQVETPLGRRYTRAGNFQMDATGVIVTNQGYPVLGTDGAQITIPPGTKAVEINGAGQIVADGNAVGQVGVFEFQDEQQMVRLGNTLYDSPTPPQPSQTARITQGAVEGSNVSGVTEMVKVLELQRSVGSTAKFIDTIYDLERKISTTMTQRKSA